MNLKCSLLIVLQFMEILARRNYEHKIKGKSNCKPRDLFPQTEMYTFTASYSYSCRFPMSISTYYKHKQYCVYVEDVYIKDCSVEMRIYQGLNSWQNTPKVTLTCDRKVKTPFCVYGSNSGIYVHYKAYRSTPSYIKIKIIPGEKPRTTTTFTPYEDSYGESMETSTLISVLTLVLGALFFLLFLCYCCCRRKGNEGTVVEESQSRGRQTSHSQQSTIPPIHTYTQGPPEYTTSLPLIQPSAPPLEYQEDRDHMMYDPPPSYDSVVNNSDRI